MGKIKETEASIYTANSYVFSPDGKSGFTQPTFIGLLEIIKGLGHSHVSEESSFTVENHELLEREEYTSENQLHLFGTEAVGL